jgi:hypothetical protein
MAEFAISLGRELDQLNGNTLKEVNGCKIDKYSNMGKFLNKGFAMVMR